jgi:hypothetical protein
MGQMGKQTTQELEAMTDCAGAETVAALREQVTDVNQQATFHRRGGVPGMVSRGVWPGRSW